MKNDLMRLNRSQAIGDIREMLLSHVDDEHSVCEVAAEHGVFCRGLSRWGLDNLKRRFPHIAEEHPDANRAELERLAHRWLVGRQFPSQGRLPCDLFAISPGCGPCAGWEEFYEADLARFYEGLFGVRIQVVPDSVAAGTPVA